LTVDKVIEVKTVCRFLAQSVYILSGLDRTVMLLMFRCYGGISAAAWQYYIDVGLVTGGNYNSGQV